MHRILLQVVLCSCVVLMMFSKASEAHLDELQKNLPSEVQLEIVRQLEGSDLFRLAQSNPYWREFIQNESSLQRKVQHFWNELPFELIREAPNQYMTVGAISPEGDQIFSFEHNFYIGRIKIYPSELNLDEKREIKIPYAGSSIIAVSRDGQKFATAQNEFILIWDSNTLKQTFAIVGHRAKITSLEFSHTGDEILSAGVNGTMHLWNSHTGRNLATFQGSESQINSIAVSPDGLQVASASEDGSIRIWNLKTGQLSKVLQGHQGSVLSIAYSQHGNRLISGGRDHLAMIWDTQTGKLLHVLRGHSSDVAAVAFSPAGGQVASASKDGTIAFWDEGTAENTFNLYGAALPTKISYDQVGTKIILWHSYGIRVFKKKFPAETRIPEGEELVIGEEIQASKKKKTLEKKCCILQ